MATIPADTRAMPAFRELGAACAASGVLMTALALLYVYSDSAIPKEQWSYPHPTGLFLVESLLLALGHLLSAGGFLGALQLGAAPSSAGRWGLIGALVGLIGLSCAELASGFIGGRANDSSIAVNVETVFGITSLVFAAGAIVAGVLILRADTWPGWGRWLVLATGVVIVVLVTPANITGNLPFRQASLVLWSLLFIPLGLDVRRGLKPRIP